MVLYFKKVSVIVRGVHLTAETGEEAADWCGGRWHPHGVAPKAGAARIDGPQLWMPHTSTGLPVAFAKTDEYEGDHIIQGVGGEFYVSRPEVFARAYEPAAEVTRASEAS